MIAVTPVVDGFGEGLLAGGGFRLALRVEAVSFGDGGVKGVEGSSQARVRIGALPVGSVATWRSTMLGKPERRGRQRCEDQGLHV